MEKKIYSFVDVLKFVFSYFIIMIHVDLFNDVNESPDIYISPFF